MPGVVEGEITQVGNTIVIDIGTVTANNPGQGFISQLANQIAQMYQGNVTINIYGAQTAQGQGAATASAWSDAGFVMTQNVVNQVTTWTK